MLRLSNSGSSFGQVISGLVLTSLCFSSLVFTSESKAQDLPSSSSTQEGDSTLSFKLEIRKITSKIQSQWYRSPSDLETGKKAVIYVTIDDMSGKLLNQKVIRSSGVRSFDQSCLQALKAAAPFVPMPKSTTNTVASQRRASFSMDLYFDGESGVVFQSGDMFGGYY
jgi:TonB family protein